MINRIRYLLLVLLTVFSCSAVASPIQMLTIAGDDSSPGIIGTYPFMAPYSWMNHILPGNPGGHSWALAAGTDSGIIFGQPQAPGEMMSIRHMYNYDTTFYSINDGLTINPDKTIDMSNLMMMYGGTLIDVGAGSGYNTLVPLLSDISQLASGENGWMLNSDGTYFLVYNTIGTCADCNLVLHLYGTAVTPVPSAVWLFASGLAGLAGIARRRKT